MVSDGLLHKLVAEKIISRQELVQLTTINREVKEFLLLLLEYQHRSMALLQRAGENHVFYVSP